MSPYLVVRTAGQPHEEHVDDTLAAPAEAAGVGPSFHTTVRDERDSAAPSRPSTARASVLMAVAAVLLASCSSSSSSSTTPSSTPTVNVINMAGKWVGTLESANLPTRTITLTVVQAGNCVDGAWVASSDWSGALSGYASESAYSGQISFERAEGGGRCGAIGTVSGSVTADTISWTGTGFTAVANCTDPLPQSVVLQLKKQ